MLQPVASYAFYHSSSGSGAPYRSKSYCGSVDAPTNKTAGKRKPHVFGCAFPFVLKRNNLHIQILP